VSDPITDEIWLAGQISTPPGYGQPTASQAEQFIVRHYNSGLATIGMNFQLSRYNVRRGGTNIGTTLNVLAARAMESNLSPGTLASTANQAVATGTITRTAGTPSNTAPVLALSLSGIITETTSYAVNTDIMLMTYQVPALPTGVTTTYGSGKRLRVDGVNIGTSITTLLANAAGFSKHFYIAYGSTAASLQGVASDTVITKAYRRVQLPIVQYYPTVNMPVGAQVPCNACSYVFQTPIYVNPGEFIVLCTFHAGTSATAGALTHSISFDYSWE
jgi:hypothetical protein